MAPTRREAAASLLTDTDITGILDANEVGWCDTCEWPYPLAERGYTDKGYRCGDCGDCSKCCQHEAQDRESYADTQDRKSYTTDHSPLATEYLAARAESRRQHPEMGD